MKHTPPSQISDQDVDVIIIGAGINGAGIARDASLRGLKVLLLDKGDIAGGTSSWSTRLIHGGLRYLEHGELGLVRESLREREVLLRIAPHLVRPLPLLLPIYRNGRRGWWTIRTGMLAYDLMSIGKSLPRHRMLTSAAALTQAPGLASRGLQGAALYYDAQVEFAERLVLENVLAAKEHGARVLTYARVDKVTIANGAVRGVEFTDLLSGETQSALARIVINASGPWVDRLATGVTNERMIGGTKGSHIVVAPFAGAPDCALYVEAASDRRPFFIVPWNGNYLIGTTDSRYDGDLDAVTITETEIEYLLVEANRVFAQAQLTRNSILFTYSGVRPLPYVTNAAEEGITRRHFIRESSSTAGFISIVGGKLTTYRSLSEQVVDLVGRKLGVSLSACVTDEVPLPGAVVLNPALLSEEYAGHSLSKLSTDRLLRIYGARTPLVLQLAETDPRLAKTFSEATGAIAAEVVFSFQHESARTLTDCLLRRTMVGLSSSLGIGDDESAARIAMDHLGWSRQRAAKEVDEYRQFVARSLRPPETH
jgi:glycerol-3-phosphate dehydrogenase